MAQSEKNKTQHMQYGTYGLCIESWKVGVKTAFGFRTSSKWCLYAIWVTVLAI